MTKLKAKFELYQRLQNLGFTYEEATQLRRIEMTLSRWAEAECSGEIEREEIGINAGKPFRVSQAWINGTADKRTAWPVADREAGALKRLKAIVDRRNERELAHERTLKHEQAGLTYAQAVEACGGEIRFYHQTDPRGCMVYLVKRSDLDGKPIDQVYNRGVAVCC